MLDLRRRQFIRLLGGATAAWPLATRAQQPGMPVVGCLVLAEDSQASLAAFLHGLKQTGYVESHNVATKHAQQTITSNGCRRSPPSL